MLGRTIFYKVGHHGSHNATLKQALEQMTHPKLVAMIPTNASFARNSKHWTMPAPKLNKALKEHTHKRLLRNDQGRNRVPDPLDPKRSEEHTSELQSPDHLVCRLLLEKKKELHITAHEIGTAH